MALAIPLSHSRLLNEIVYVCAWLTNLEPVLVSPSHMKPCESSASVTDFPLPSDETELEASSDEWSSLSAMDD